MADVLATPWSHSAPHPLPPPSRVSFARVAAPVGPARPGATSDDPLACPWRGVAMTLRRLPVTALPVLGPALPGPRTPVVEALEPA